MQKFDYVSDFKLRTKTNFDLVINVLGNNICNFGSENLISKQNQISAAENNKYSES